LRAIPRRETGCVDDVEEDKARNSSTALSTGFAGSKEEEVEKEFGCAIPGDDDSGVDGEVGVTAGYPWGISGVYGSSMKDGVWSASSSDACVNGKSGIDDTRDVVGWFSKSSDSSDDIFCEIERKKRMKEEEKKGEKEKKAKKRETKGAKNGMPARTPTKKPGDEKHAPLDVHSKEQ